jgi:hypothetical protein
MQTAQTNAGGLDAVANLILGAHNSPPRLQGFEDLVREGVVLQVGDHSSLGLTWPPYDRNPPALALLTPNMQGGSTDLRINGGRTGARC